MHAFSLQIDDRGQAHASSIIWVPDGTKNSHCETATCDGYFDVYPTREEAEENWENAMGKPYTDNKLNKELCTVSA